MQRKTENQKRKMKEKWLYGHFKQQINDIFHKKTWTWPRKRNLKGETESLLIGVQNNAIRTNYDKARIDKMQQNSRCRLCGDRDETINYIISTCISWCKKSIRLGINSWGRWSTGNSARSLNLSKWTNSICTTQNLS